jgi:hypothetical protein
MKTKEFIKMLQDADPSGEAHIRMEGGIPISAQIKEGYWDGPFSYLDENENYVYSIEGYKVDIYCRDIWDHVDWMVDYDTKTSWEEVEKTFKFELGGYALKESRDDKKQRVLDQGKEAYDEIMNINKRIEEKYGSKTK